MFESLSIESLLEIPPCRRFESRSTETTGERTVGADSISEITCHTLSHDASTSVATLTITGDVHMWKEAVFS